MTNETEYDSALAIMRGKQPNIALARRLLDEASKKGDARADYALGTWYLHGTYVNKDVVKGNYLLEKAAECDISEACYDIAVSYENGNGVKRDFNVAIKWYIRGMILGNLQCIYEVGRCIHYGVGTRKNAKLAGIFLDYAAKHEID